MIAAVEVVCVKGCHGGGTSVPARAAIISAFAAAAGVGLGLFQLRRVVRSVGIGEQSNTINAISHCAQRYHEIMRDVKNGGRGVKADEFEPGSWWYRYWDLHTEQYTLFRKGLLDPEVYALWMTELATLYNVSPRDDVEVETRAVAHTEYMDRTLPHHIELQSFFRQLSGISFDVDPASRGAQVRSLIAANAHKPTNRCPMRRFRAQDRNVEASPELPPPYLVIVSRKAIQRRVTELGRLIRSHYGEEAVVLLVVLKGASAFAHDLGREIGGVASQEFVRASSYKSGTKAQPVQVGEIPKAALEGRHVLIVDDILETGKTLDAIKREIDEIATASKAICVLLQKPSKIIIPSYNRMLWMALRG